MAFVANYEGVMIIREVSQTTLEGRCRFEKERNTLDSVPVFDSLHECLKSLDTYGKKTILPNGDSIIPRIYNYPNNY